jgi:hydrogenase expression/formation protein HypE
MSSEHNVIQLAHGGGGRLTHDLITDEIVTRFGNGPLRGLPDGAMLDSPGERLVFTTDSFVVQPLEFPGGNIGDLAVHGTVNDISVCGGEPRWLSLALILEEGLSFDVLRRVLDSVQVAAEACDVMVVTGDTKVVERGQCDGVYVNTAGIGLALPCFILGPERIREGDHVLVSGTLADHGMALLAARQKTNLSDGPQSDTGPVHRLVQAVQALGTAVRFMRDPTRGGAATVLNEMVNGSELGILLKEHDIPLAPATRAVAEMMGIEPLHVASEGRLILICAADAAESILGRWRALPEGAGAACLGTVTRDRGRVVMQTVTGGCRLVDVPRGELLPRIC